jgi:nucleotide-binding universal stress UspA family protein
MCKDPRDSKFNIFVPVDGAEVSRNAAEVAFALARANDAPVAAMYVSGAMAADPAHRRSNRSRATRRNEKAVLDDIAQLANRYGVKVKTAVRASVAIAYLPPGLSTRGAALQG